MRFLRNVLNRNILHCTNVGVCVKLEAGCQLIVKKASALKKRYAHRKYNALDVHISCDI